jgi:hypothetical protein
MNVVVIPEKSWSHIFYGFERRLLGLATVDGNTNVFSIEEEEAP